MITMSAASIASAFDGTLRPPTSFASASASSGVVEVTTIWCPADDSVRASAPQRFPCR